MLEIVEIRRHEELARLRPAWDELLAASAADTLFLSWEWVSRWLEVFGPRSDLRLLAAFDSDGALVGIAPLIVFRRFLMFLGQGADTKAEFLDFIVRRGREAEITPLLCRHAIEKLAGEWDWVHFERIPVGSPNLPLLGSAFGAAGQDTRLAGEERAPYLELPASWDEFLGARTKKFRNQWRNSWRRLRRQGEVAVLCAGEDLELDDAFDELRRLHLARWSEGGLSFRTEDYLRFHRSLARTLSARGDLGLLLLAVDGVPVAASYDFVYGGKTWGMQGGWDPSFAHERVGAIVTGEAIRWSIERGLAEYDFLGMDYAYKLRWASDCREMVNLTSVPASLRRNRS